MKHEEINLKVSEKFFVCRKFLSTANRFNLVLEMCRERVAVCLARWRLHHRAGSSIMKSVNTSAATYNFLLLTFFRQLFHTLAFKNLFFLFLPSHPPRRRVVVEWATERIFEKSFFRKNVLLLIKFFSCTHMAHSTRPRLNTLRANSASNRHSANANFPLILAWRNLPIYILTKCCHERLKTEPRNIRNKTKRASEKKLPPSTSCLVDAGKLF